jgi:hypothetical protein
MRVCPIRFNTSWPQGDVDDKINKILLSAPGDSRENSWLYLSVVLFMLTSRREVKPCCVHPPVAVLENGASLDDILNGAPIRELRRQHGGPEPHLRDLREPTDVASLRRRVRAELHRGQERGQKDGRSRMSPDHEFRQRPCFQSGGRLYERKGSSWTPTRAPDSLPIDTFQQDGVKPAPRSTPRRRRTRPTRLSSTTT